MTITEGEHITPKIGIIIPPPDVRNIVDRTAEFVARNGPEFEARVKLNEANNSKFNFLNSLDPYNAYYNQRVKQYIEGTVDSISAKISVPTAMKLAQDTPKAIQEVFEPKEPPPEFEFMVDPPSINGLELDIVKLTAQFVARNGRQFLTQLMNREQRNYLFDFLRPQHNMFSYFTKLVEQFTKILLPPNDIIEKLDSESRAPEIFMKNCKYRVAWDRFQARQRKREMEAEDKERLAYGQIDWHDFVVVEMVDYQPNEVGNFPPPTVPEEVGARTIAEERGETIVNRWVEDKADNSDRRIEVDEDDNESEEEMESVPRAEKDGDLAEEDMEMSESDSDSDAGDGDIPAPPPSLHPSVFKQPSEAGRPNLVRPDDVMVRPYDPKSRQKRPTDEVYLISPLGDNKKVSSSQANKHIHVGLLDPGWREHRDRNIRNRAQDDTPYASGNLVDLNLKTMAERRTDIFGIEETMIGRKVGEEDSGKRTERYIWDGRATQSELSVSRASDSTGTAGRGGSAAAGDSKIDSTTGTNPGNVIDNGTASNKQIDIDRIGPQAVPQIAPPTITIIVNTPIITPSVATIAPPPPPPPPVVSSVVTEDDDNEPIDKKAKIG